MVRCYNCSKEINDRVTICPYCHMIQRNVTEHREARPTNIKQKAIVSRAVPAQVIQPRQIKPSEYRRTCARCGQVWYSLITREKVLKAQHKLQTCSTLCFMCYPLLFLQSQRNMEVQASELTRLHTCPNCGSMTYYEDQIA